MSVALQLQQMALDELLAVIERNRAVEPVGIYSVCTSHPLALEAAIRQAKHDKSVLLVEATANQVNQFGGYTGMIPAEFPEFIHSIADDVGLPRDRIVLGGDHLGPVCWVDESPGVAMKMACELVKDYVTAGFRKIHLDASMACAGDTAPLDDAIVAARAVKLCKAAEQAAAAGGRSDKPVYIIGTEVPVPGGATEGLDEISVTSVDRAANTVNTHRRAFLDAGLADAWNRVIGLVVQPGVEFNHTSVYRYRPEDARDLSAAVLDFPGLVYEAHSTDYQHVQAYRHLVRDHFAILKVGPQLTFALREALFALAAIEDELVAPADRSNLLEVAEQVMLAEPVHWNRHYPGSEPEGRLYRRYSYSDRIRYYWPQPKMQRSVDTLMCNLRQHAIPLPMLHQHLPRSADAIAAGALQSDPREVVIHHVMAVTKDYSEACRNNG